jgi:hypothetical protein
MLRNLRHNDPQSNSIDDICVSFYEGYNCLVFSAISRSHFSSTNNSAGNGTKTSSISNIRIIDKMTGRVVDTIVNLYPTLESPAVQLNRPCNG